jgi:hypothetical protein
MTALVHSSLAARPSVTFSRAGTSPGTLGRLLVGAAEINTALWERKRRETT